MTAKRRIEAHTFQPGERLNPSPQPLCFYDGANPGELRELLDKGLDIMGVTTNPTLVAKHPKIAKLIADGKRISEQEAYEEYRDIVVELHEILTEHNPLYHSISVEPRCDAETTAAELLENAKQMIDLFSGHPELKDKLLIKLPATPEGAEVAPQIIELGFGVNGTVCFDQESALMWAAATKDAAAQHVKVVISPFVGRSEKQEFDGKKHNGVDLVRNIKKMYGEAGYSHVKILAASIPTENHFYGVWEAGADIITSPKKPTLDAIVSREQISLPTGFSYPNPSTAENPVARQEYRELEYGLSRDEYIENAKNNPNYARGKHPLALRGIQAFIKDLSGDNGFVDMAKTAANAALTD